MLQRTVSAAFIPPCLPTKAHTLPSGDLWLHEIKHDGFRVIARKDGDRVRLYSRPGNDMTRRCADVRFTLGDGAPMIGLFIKSGRAWFWELMFWLLIVELARVIGG